MATPASVTPSATNSSNKSRAFLALSDLLDEIHGAVVYLSGTENCGLKQIFALMTPTCCVARGRGYDKMFAMIATARFYFDHDLTETRLQRSRITGRVPNLLDTGF